MAGRLKKVIPSAPNFWCHSFSEWYFQCIVICLFLIRKSGEQTVDGDLALRDWF